MRGSHPRARHAAVARATDFAMGAKVVGAHRGRHPARDRARRAIAEARLTGLPRTRWPGNSGSSSVFTVPKSRSTLPRPWGRATVE